MVWFTGQHEESIDDLIADFGLESEFVLPQNMKERSSIGKLLVWIPQTLYRCYQYVHSVKLWTGSRPLVVVHGDTLSTWLSALAGRWGGGDIVHLESGLSSGKWNDPFPEEMLRRLTFRKARYAICPNDEAATRMEKYTGCIVVNTKENTLLDCVRFAIGEARNPPQLAQSSARQYFVVSIHRFKNIYSKEELVRIVDEIEVLTRFGEVYFVMHPPTENRLKKYGMYQALGELPRLHLSPRMPYTTFLALLGDARAVFTDGGSNQEELAYLGVPTVLYRDRSERPDGLGENVRLRAELPRSLSEYIAEHEIDELRRPSKIDASVEPSKDTVEALRRWAGGAS